MSDNTNFQEHLEVVAKDFQERAGESSGLVPDQERKIIKEIVQEKFSPPVPAGAGTAAAQASDDKNQTSSPVGRTPAHEDLSAQYQSVVDGFIQDALSGDLTKVVQAVNHSNNPWIIDQFHDVLVDKFYSEIKARRQGGS